MNGDGKRHPEVENRTYDDREHALYTHCADWIWDEEESTQPGEPPERQEASLDDGAVERVAGQCLKDMKWAALLCEWIVGIRTKLWC